MRTQLVKSDYLEWYKKKQPINILKHFSKLKETPFNKKTFGYVASLASVYSSMIEGNRMDYDSFVKYSSSGITNKSKSYKEIQDLIKAYEFASKHDLNIHTFFTAHEILSKTVIKNPELRGEFRKSGVRVGNETITVYVGPKPDVAKKDIHSLFNDIEILITRVMTFTEVFYYASMIHLVFVKIHPFSDGNGRAARLLEKWFLSKKLGEKAWFIQSERLYQTRLYSYYKNLNLGYSYELNNYDLCLPFLLMLPMSLTSKK